MTRSLPQLASFCLALLTAYAGLATAGPRIPAQEPAIAALRTLGVDEVFEPVVPTSLPAVAAPTWTMGHGCSTRTGAAASTRRRTTRS